MKVKTAKNLKQGQTVWHTSKKNADGTPMRAKVTSVKTWKRNPARVIVKVKHGLYDFAEFHAFQLDQITDIEP